MSIFLFEASLEVLSLPPLATSLQMLRGARAFTSVKYLQPALSIVATGVRVTYIDMYMISVISPHVQRGFSKTHSMKQICSTFPQHDESN